VSWQPEEPAPQHGLKLNRLPAPSCRSRPRAGTGWQLPDEGAFCVGLLGRVPPPLQGTGAVTRTSLASVCPMHSCAWPRLRPSGERHLPSPCWAPELPCPRDSPSPGAPEPARACHRSRQIEASYRWQLISSLQIIELQTCFLTVRSVKEATAWRGHISAGGSPVSCVAAIFGGWGMASSPARLTSRTPPLPPCSSPSLLRGHLHPSKRTRCSAPQMPLATSPSRAPCGSRAWCNPWAAHPWSADQAARRPPGWASSTTCFPARSPAPRKCSMPVPAPRHFPQGCRARARAHVPGSRSSRWAFMGTDSVVRRGKEIGRCRWEGQHPRARGAAPRPLHRTPTPSAAAIANACWCEQDRKASRDVMEA